MMGDSKRSVSGSFSHNQTILSALGAALLCAFTVVAQAGGADAVDVLKATTDALSVASKTSALNTCSATLRV